MTGFKILEFKKSQYSYDAIEKALSEKVSEGWKVVSLHTDVSTDLRGIVVVLLQQIILGEEETMSYQELYEKKQAELAIKRIQKDIDELDEPYATGASVRLGETPSMRAARTNGDINGLLGLGMSGAPSSRAVTVANNDVQPQAGKFCTNCGAPIGTGKFCGSCGNPL